MSCYQRARRRLFWRGFAIALLIWTAFTTLGALLA